MKQGTVVHSSIYGDYQSVSQGPCRRQAISMDGESTYEVVQKQEDVEYHVLDTGQSAWNQICTCKVGEKQR